MATLKSSDPTPLSFNVDDADVPRVSRYQWYLHVNNNLRTRVFMKRLRWNDRLQIIEEDPESKTTPVWIPLDRFVLAITPHTNTRIVHPPGGIPSKDGDRLECRRQWMRIEPKVQGRHKFIGIEKLNNGKWCAYDPKMGMIGSNTFTMEELAAREYDKYIVQQSPRVIKTNFYYNL